MFRANQFSLFVRIDFHLFGLISSCSDRFPFVRTDFQLFGPISIICSDEFVVRNGGKIGAAKWREDLWCEMAGRLGLRN